MLRKKGKRSKGDEVKLEMTPMIDVVFQLLIFFIVSIKQEDILSSIQVMRPQSNPGPSTDVEPTTIIVTSKGFQFRNKPMIEAELSRALEQIAGYDKDKLIVIKCTMDSQHQYLMRVLDICAKHGLRNLAVFTM